LPYHSTVHYDEDALSPSRVSDFLSTAFHAPEHILIAAGSYAIAIDGGLGAVISW